MTKAMRKATILAGCLALAGCGPAAKVATKVFAGGGDEAARTAKAAGAGGAADEAGGLGREVAGQGAQQGVQQVAAPGDEERRKR